MKQLNYQKKLASDGAPKFVNGLLDKVVKGLIMTKSMKLCVSLDLATAQGEFSFS